MTLVSYGFGVDECQAFPLPDTWRVTMNATKHWSLQTGRHGHMPELSDANNALAEQVVALDESRKGKAWYTSTQERQP